MPPTNQKIPFFIDNLGWPYIYQSLTLNFLFSLKSVYEIALDFALICMPDIFGIFHLENATLLSPCECVFKLPLYLCSQVKGFINIRQEIIDQVINSEIFQPALSIGLQEKERDYQNIGTAVKKLQLTFFRLLQIGKSPLFTDPHSVTHCSGNIQILLNIHAQTSTSFRVLHNETNYVNGNVIIQARTICA